MMNIMNVQGTASVQSGTSKSHEDQMKTTLDSVQGLSHSQERDSEQHLARTI